MLTVVEHDLTDGEIAQKVADIFDLRPGIIEQRLKLRQPMYAETAAYGHMGRTNETVSKKFIRSNGAEQEELEVDVELFTWEKLDFVAEIKNRFSLNG